MPITINGSGTVTGITAGGLPDGVITTDDIAANAISTAKLADAAITRAKMGYAGAILQVVTANKDSEGSTTSTSFTDTGLSVSITPSSASSKIFVLYTGTAGNDGTQESYFTLVRGSTNLGNGTQGLMRVWYSGSSGYHFGGLSMSYLDSPSTTSATTYKVQYRTASGTVYTSAGNARDTLTVFEVAS